MAIEINEFVKEVLDAPCFGFIGATNEDNQMVITRFFGYQYTNPMTTLTVFVNKEDAQRVVNQLKEGKRITVTTSNSMNFKTVQYKGTYNSHYDSTEEELAISKKTYEAQREMLVMFGIPKEVSANWKTEPSQAIVINVEEIFDQTPKINTGNKIN